jgi:hypothetical protein
MPTVHSCFEADEMFVTLDTLSAPRSFDAYAPT